MDSTGPGRLSLAGFALEPASCYNPVSTGVFKKNRVTG